MSAALFITLDGEIGLDTFVDGKALSTALDILDDLAHQLRVKSLMEFFSPDPGNLLETEGLESTWDEEWFAASAGLATVRALLSHLEANDILGLEKRAVIADLKKFEQVLGTADAKGLRWHLEVDY